jgi:hypothetical protein
MREYININMITIRNATFNIISVLNIVSVSFIGGGNRSTRRKHPTCRKSLKSNNIKSNNTMLYKIKSPGWISYNCISSLITFIIYHLITYYGCMQAIFFKVVNNLFKKWSIHKMIMTLVDFVTCHVHIHISIDIIHLTITDFKINLIRHSVISMMVHEWYWS